MATTDKIKERVAAFVRELAEELGEANEQEALCWLDAIETQAVEIGDAVSVALLSHKAQGRPVANEATCPTCGKLGRYQGLRERDLISRRGKARISEPEFYCPACRRDFFPDGQRNRS